MAKPTSLEQQCFLHVLQHLEKFPVGHLSLLPLGVRQRLLLIAPVADVFQLEHTMFVKGIDMDEVWKTVYEQRLPLIRPSLPDLRTTFGDETPPRELMKTAIAFEILHIPHTAPPRPGSRLIPHGDYQRQRYHPRNSGSAVTSVQHNALFSILLKDDDSICSATADGSTEPLDAHPGLFQLAGRKLGSQEEKEVQACHVPVPSRYALYDTATSDDNLKKVEDFMATTCQALPSMAFINCNTIRQELPIRGELLTKVEHISLKCHIGGDFCDQDIAQHISSALSLLESLLHHSSNLQHITFLGICSDELIDVLTRQVARLLTSKTEHTVKRLSISVHHIDRNYGLCRNAWDWAFERQESRRQEASRNLGIMIPHMSSLHTLKLNVWWTGQSEHAHPDHVSLLDVLCSFLEQPHFQCLSLVNTCLPLVYIQRLVRTFLLSPCSQPQTLSLEKVSLTSRLGLIHRLRCNYSADEKTKLPLTEWDSQSDYSILSENATREFKSLVIAFPSGGHHKDDRVALEAARSWLLDLSHFEYKLKSLIVQGDPSFR